METDAKKTQTILVVEDEKPYSRALILKLEHAGFKVKDACDGEEALKMVSQEKFDLVLLDLVLPKLNGFEILEEIKKRGIAMPPVFVLSNLAQNEDKNRIKTLGADEFLEKANTPIVEVVEKVKKILEK